MNNAKLTKNDLVQSENFKVYLDPGGLNDVGACKIFKNVLYKQSSRNAIKYDWLNSIVSKDRFRFCRKKNNICF